MDINEFVKGMNDPKLKEAITNLGNTLGKKDVIYFITQHIP